jgi:trehalose 6-phosphate phosphatase
MRRVFDCWSQIASRVRSAGSVALFLDFDGTLAGIRPVPAEVELSGPTRQAIARLASSARVRVWVISGRKRNDVRDKTRVSRAKYLGVHGWEGRPRNSLLAETQRELEHAKRTLAKSVEALRGIWIEDKGSAFAVHYRGASDTESNLARASVRGVMAGLNGRFRLLNGKKIWEILPSEMGDKGSAVRRELIRLEHGTLPVYLGDDLTDESAFAALPDGLTIRVGPCSLTRAQFQLCDPRDVRRFLEKLEAELS